MLKCLLNVKMPTIVGILTFISRIIPDLCALNFFILMDYLKHIILIQNLHALTLLFSWINLKHIDTICMELSILYFKGLPVKTSIK